MKQLSFNESRYGDYVLFVRKMKRTMHFKRVDRLGKLQNCAMGFTAANDGVTFERVGRDVDLSFDAMRGVHEVGCYSAWPTS